MNPTYKIREFNCDCGCPVVAEFDNQCDAIAYAQRHQHRADNHAEYGCHVSYVVYRCYPRTIRSDKVYRVGSTRDRREFAASLRKGGASC